MGIFNWFSGLFAPQKPLSEVIHYLEQRMTVMAYSFNTYQLIFQFKPNSLEQTKTIFPIV